MFGHPNETLFLVFDIITSKQWSDSNLFDCAFSFWESNLHPIWESDFFRVYVSPRIYVISFCYFTVTFYTPKYLQELLSDRKKDLGDLVVHYIHIHTTVWKSESKNSPEYHHMVWNGAANNQIYKGMSGPFPQHYKTPTGIQWTPCKSQVSSNLIMLSVKSPTAPPFPPPPQPGNRRGGGGNLFIN